MSTSNPSSLIRLVVWVVIGWVIYFSYGCRKSVANTRKKQLQKEKIGDGEFQMLGDRFSHFVDDEVGIELQAVDGPFAADDKPLL